MARAEQFKKDFDSRFRPGASRAAVDEFLKAQPVRVPPLLGWQENEPHQYVKQLAIEIAKERHDVWFRSRMSIGIEATFSPDQLLKKTEVAVSGVDCP